MDYINPNPRSATDKEKVAAEFLGELFLAEDVKDIMDKINSQDNVPALLRERKFPTQIKDIMNDQTISLNDRHSHMLALIRESKAPLMEPWKVKDMSLEQLRTHYRSAVKYISQQPQVISSLNLTLIGLIRQQIKSHQARSQDMTGTINRQKVIVITSSTISDTGYRQLAQEIGKVEGGDTEYSIPTIHLRERTIEQSKKLHQKLNDKNIEGKYIYDYIPVDVNRLLEVGPSPVLLGKMLFSHMKS